MQNKKTFKHLVFSLIVMVSFTFEAFPQEHEMPMSLEEALNHAAEFGFDNQISIREVEAAKAQFTQSNAAFLPHIFFEETAMQTNDPIGVFGIKLRQGIITNADFNPDLLNDPDAEGNFNTRFQLNQPIFNPDAYLQRSTAKYMLKSVQDQQKVTREYTRLNVKEAYFQLVVIDEQIRVVQSFLETVQSIKNQSKNFFNQGIINRADYLNAEVQVLNAEKDLLVVQNSRKTVNDQLLIQLGITDPKTIKPTDPMEISSTESYKSVIFLGDNSTLSAINNQVMASEAMLKSSRFKFLPKLNVFGSYEFNDSGFLGMDASNYTLGASLRWDLFQGMKNIGEVAKNRADFKKAEIMYQQKFVEMQTQTEIIKRSINEALKSLELSDLVVEQSIENVRIRSDRYEQGLEKTTDLLQSQSQLLNHELERLQVHFSYLMAVANLEFILETDL